MILRAVRLVAPVACAAVALVLPVAVDAPLAQAADPDIHAEWRGWVAYERSRSTSGEVSEHVVERSWSVDINRAAGGSEWQGSVYSLQEQFIEDCGMRALEYSGEGMGRVARNPESPYDTYATSGGQDHHGFPAGTPSIDWNLGNSGSVEVQDFVYNCGDPQWADGLRPVEAPGYLAGAAGSYDDPPLTAANDHSWQAGDDRLRSIVCMSRSTVDSDSDGLPDEVDLAPLQHGSALGLGHPMGSAAWSSLIESPYGGPDGQQGLPSCPAAPEQPPGGTRYVAMGDSFQSGEGARDYGDTKDDLTRMGPDSGLPPTGKPVRDFEGQDEGCHRSPNAYGPRVAEALGYSGSDFTFAACSGALSQHIRSESFKGEVPQIEELGPDVELVTLGIGGNDVGFADTLTKCIKGTKPCNETEYDSVWRLMEKLVRRPQGPGTRSTLENTYLAVLEAAPNARVLILGYARFFPEDAHQNALKCSGIGVAEQEWVNGTVGMLNLFIATTVSRLAAEGHDIAYVDIEDVGTDHELCGGWQPTIGFPGGLGVPGPEDPLWREFMNGVEFNYYETDNPLAALPFQPDTIVVPVRSSESFHPNALGHSLIAPLVQQAAGTLPSHASARSTNSTSFAATVTNEPPVAAFAISVSGSEIALDASTSSDADGSVVEYVWDFGDGTSATGATVRHTYREGGHHTPKLVVTDDGGFVDIAIGDTVSIDLDRVDRLSGQDRIETALAVSSTSFPDPDTAGAVVLATAGGYPDALAGVPLAATLGGPILLNPSDALDGRVAEEIDRLLPEGRTVVLLGGTAVLSDEVEQAVRDRGYQVVRLGGEDRFATARIIAEGGMGSPELVFLVTGRNFADALAAAAPAIAYRGAILLTGTDEAVTATSEYIAANPQAQFIALGGPAARAYPDHPSIIGGDRYATATMIADTFWPNPTRIGIASGTNFPDALAGGVHTGTNFGPMLLVPPSGPLPDSVADYLARHADTIDDHSYLYGGPTALGDDILEAVGVAIE